MNLEQAQAAARAALEKHHYKDVCSVVQYQDTKDPKTKLTRKQEVTVLENQPDAGVCQVWNPGSGCGHR